MCLSEKEKNTVSCKAEMHQQEVAGQPCEEPHAAAWRGVGAVPSPGNPPSLSSASEGKDFQTDVQTKEDAFCRQAEVLALHHLMDNRIIKDNEMKQH